MSIFSSNWMDVCSWYFRKNRAMSGPLVHAYIMINIKEIHTGNCMRFAVTDR